MNERDKMFLYGKNSIYERLKAKPESIKKISMQEGFDSKLIEEMIKKANVPTQRMTAHQLSKINPVKDLQGIIAEVDRYEYIPFDNLLTEKKRTLIFLDRINDPHNLGVIIRTSACFGGFAIVIPRHEACEVNDTVIHVASGGENYMPVSIVANLANAIIKAKKHEYWIFGATVDEDAEEIGKVTFPSPLALVLGSEGFGIRYGVDKQLDTRVRIPMKGAALSFNVNMACAIFCYEVSKQLGR